VSRSDLDVVAVAAPNELHHPVAMAAIDAGKHVLCEKPLAATAKDAWELADAARRAGVVTATAFELRWLPDKLAVLDLVRQGYVGDAHFMRISQSKDLWHPSHRPMSAWVYDLEVGGGHLNAAVSHDIDFVRAALGEVMAVFGEVRTMSTERELADGAVMTVTGDDSGVVALRMACGALAVLTYTAAGVHAASEELELFGTGGSIVTQTSGSASRKGKRAEDRLRCGTVDDDALADFLPSAREPRTRPDLPPNRFTSLAIRSFAMMLEDWLPAFDGSPVTVPSFADGVAVQAVIEAARMSATQGRWVAPEETIA
jgi:predicted dehydrogenase